MRKLSPILVFRVGFVLLLAASWVVLRDRKAAAAFSQDGPDPDERFVVETNLPTGSLSFEVLEEKTGIHLPARLFFAYADGQPEVPTVGRFENILVTASGYGVKIIPAGEYDVYISRGLEYTLDHQQVTISVGKMTHLSSTLSRAIDTSGFISSDFHLHLQFAMRDGAQVAAAEGLDLLTATDHNILKDYSPYITQLNLERFMTSVVGAEVDTAFGHFNSFPMSVNQWQDKTFRHAIRTPGEMLRLMRENPGEEIVQINHPRRWEPNPKSGYFDGRLNRETSEIEYPFFEMSFDQVEVFNALTDKEENGHVGRTALVEQKLKDWFSLLNRGVLMTGVANTDAHKYPSHLPGYPRNYVLSETDNPWEIDAYRVVDALKSRASTGSFGPFIRITANDGAPVGSIITDTDGSTTLHVSVQAAPWIPVDRVEVVANGEVLQTFSIETLTEATRFAKDIDLGPARDTWYLVLATSDRSWEPPFSNFSSFAFTNAIFVDVDGNGYFDPPNPGYPVALGEGQ
ncbi:CehA/McbA family metallohydrolase [Acidobacteria bacterium AH-259-A15]|nr:CehA/McbA family metallohydrolase [Acidobacteria bacterium AH-259-A15]